MKRRVFVTGASGYLGSGIAPRLVRAGFEVTGLIHGESRGATLRSAGVRTVAGDFEHREGWDGALRNADVVVHAAWNRGDTAAQDQEALAAIRAAIQDGRVRRVVYTSGLWVYGDSGSRVIDETQPLAPLPIAAWRAAHEEVAFDLSHFDAEVLVMRPAIVYGESRGILGQWFEEARDSGTVTVPGTGEQFWPLVHRDDVSDAYALAVEHGAAGERYNLCDESQLTARQIGEAVARATGARLQFRPAETVREELGAYGEALLASEKATSARARRDLGWVPRHTHFVREVDDLFREWSAGREAPVA